MSAGRRSALVALALLGALVAPGAQAERTVLESTYDDRDAGREGAQAVEAEIGVLDDPELEGYVQGIGDKLLRALPRRQFQYRFRVVDQVEPNAFALPGGQIFVSRGLLALANDEDELACVIAHEIGHVAKRHAAAQQATARGQFPLLSPWLRAGRMAAYSRDLERSADHDGQILCAAAGYDPRGLASFLDSLMNFEKLQTGLIRRASYFDTHPLSSERATIASVQASELRWKRDPALAAPRASLLARIEGLPLGQRPESGIFIGDVFLHPGLDFKLRFPRRWEKANTASAVGAQSPRGDAVVFLMADVPKGEPRQVAEQWAVKSLGGQGRVQQGGPFSVGRIRAWQLDVVGSTGGARVRALVTFIPYGDSIWRVTGAGIADEDLERTLATTRSFRELDDQDRAAIKATRVHVVRAEPAEDLHALTTRTQSVWSAYETSIYNGLSPGHRFSGGESVKIAREEPWRGAPGS